jgi:hypothetical protein
MKQFLTILCLMSLLSLHSCTRSCTNCKSYTSENKDTLVNSKDYCARDAMEIEGYEDGFIEGANQEGWHAECERICP